MKIIKLAKLLAVVSIIGGTLSVSAATTTQVLEAETMNHGVGVISSDGNSWQADVSMTPTSHMVYGSAPLPLGNGGAQAIFTLKIDVTNALNTDMVARLDVYDSSDGAILAVRDIGRNELQSDTYQDFSLPFTTAGRGANTTIEYRVWYGDTALLNVDKVTIVADTFDAGTPTIINKSGASDAHVAVLVAKAVKGLGFSTGDYSAPNAMDQIFVGQYYMAWIDQTGFYGKMNGLWLLNGSSTDTLEFIQYDGTRPYNFFVVGESGAGQWLENYTGSEHFEIPHRVKEANDPDTCDDNGIDSLCNWYSVSEADAITGSNLPHWNACQNGKMSWAQHNGPSTSTATDISLELIYQAPITKESDNDSDKSDGDACHTNVLFEDGFRRRVNLNIGYKLYSDKPYFDRTYQYDNPSTNSTAFGLGEIGSWSVIHGLLITKTTGGIQAKLDIRDNIYLNEHTFGAKDPGTWYNIDPGTITSDDVWSWLGQSYTLSSDQTYTAGSSINLAHKGEYNNSDIGLCTCVVHGALEIGGGVLHGNAVNDVEPGDQSIVAVKRVTFPQGSATTSTTNDPLGSTDYTTYTYNGAAMSHSLGALSNTTAWKADTAVDASGHMIYGPYVAFGSSTNAKAAFKMKIDVNTGNSDKVVTIDVYDSTAGTVVASQDVLRTDFAKSNAYIDFVLPFSLTGRSTNSLETRVYWYDNAAITVERVTVVTKN